MGTARKTLGWANREGEMNVALQFLHFSVVFTGSMLMDTRALLFPKHVHDTDEVAVIYLQPLKSPISLVGMSQRL